MPHGRNRFLLKRRPGVINNDFIKDDGITLETRNLYDQGSGYQTLLQAMPALKRLTFKRIFENIEFPDSNFRNFKEGKDTRIF
jgi:hypothetical protein